MLNFDSWIDCMGTSQVGWIEIDEEFDQTGGYYRRIVNWTRVGERLSFFSSLICVF